MTPGKLLKKQLGLESFKFVQYARIIGIGGYKIYFIFYDSRMPHIRWTSWEAFRREFAPVIPYKEGNTQRLSLTNLLPIEEWSGTTAGCLFIRIDLSGRFLHPPSYKAVVKEGNLEELFINKNYLIEDFTIEQFKDVAAISAMTQKFRTQRRQMLGKEIANVKLMNIKFNKSQDWVEFQFRSISTPNTTSKQKANQGGAFTLRPNPPKVYTLLIRMNNFFTWMLGTLPDGQELTIKDMKDAIRVCPVKLWSNSPAFHWQGINYNLSQLDAALAPTGIAPEFWNQPKYHGDNALLDKHLAALIRNISFFLNNMTSMLNKTLQDAGIIKKVRYNYQS